MSEEEGVRARQYTKRLYYFIRDYPELCKDGWNIFPYNGLTRWIKGVGYIDRTQHKFQIEYWLNPRANEIGYQITWYNFQDTFKMYKGPYTPKQYLCETKEKVVAFLNTLFDKFWPEKPHTSRWHESFFDSDQWDPVPDRFVSRD